jgi:ankyrin repeat protein
MGNLSDKLMNCCASLLLAAIISIEAGGQQVAFNDQINDPDYLLLVSASIGDTARIVSLLKDGADIDAQTLEGATPLMLAVQYRQAPAVKLLIEAGADPDISTYFRVTPLIAAIRDQNLEIAEMLIRAGANIDARDINGATALHYAALFGFYYEADMLIYYEALNDLKATDGTTPLMAAVMSGSFDIADILIRNGSNVNSTDNKGYTPLLLAAQNGDTLVMELLLMSGADLYAVASDRYNATAIAVRDANIWLFSYLFRKGTLWRQETGAVNMWLVAEQYRRKEFLTILREYGVPNHGNHHINSVSAELSALVSRHQLFTGVAVKSRRDISGLGAIAGVDFKPFKSRIILKQSNDEYLQYIDRRYVAYAGIFKDMIISDKTGINSWVLTFTGKAAYKFGNIYPGSNLKPEHKLAFIPSVSLSFEIPSFTFSVATDFMKSEVYKSGPLWFRAGISYNYYPEKVKSRGKVIRWL